MTFWPCWINFWVVIFDYDDWWTKNLTSHKKHHIIVKTNVRMEAASIITTLAKSINYDITIRVLMTWRRRWQHNKQRRYRFEQHSCTMSFGLEDDMQAERLLRVTNWWWKRTLLSVGVLYSCTLIPAVAGYSTTAAMVLTLPQLNYGCCQKRFGSCFKKVAGVRGCSRSLANGNTVFVNFYLIKGTCTRAAG
jgi:hypothetical protein